MKEEIIENEEIQTILVSDPSVPPSIKKIVQELQEPGDELYKVETDIGIEWWLIDSDGELIESLWLE